MRKSVALLLSLSVVSACGGSGGSGVDAYSAREAVALNLFSDVSASGISDPATLPFTSGEVTYLGAIGAANAYGGTIVGDLEINVMFADSTLSGTADNFIDDENDTYTGELDITNGVIDRNPLTLPSFQANINGVLSDGGANTVVAGSLLGVFAGTSEEGMFGFIEGTAVTPGVGSQFLDEGNTAFAAVQ